MKEHEIQVLLNSYRHLKGLEAVLEKILLEQNAIACKRCERKHGLNRCDIFVAVVSS